MFLSKMGLLLLSGFQLRSVGPCLLLCCHHAVFVTMAPQYNLKSDVWHLPHYSLAEDCFALAIQSIFIVFLWVL